MGDPGVDDIGVAWNPGVWLSKMPFELLGFKNTAEVALVMAPVFPVSLPQSPQRPNGVTLIAPSCPQEPEMVPLGARFLALYQLLALQRARRF